MIKILELFGGIGACSKALEKLNINYEIVDYVEIDKYAVKSYNAIHNTNFEPQDICKWDKDIKVDLIMHGSPCQDFSIAGNQAGGDKNSGTRSSLMYETIRIVEKLNPKYIIWENVKNLLSKKHKHNFNAYFETMENLGYNNYYQVLNAKDYGVPQNRERVFTVSIRKDINKTFMFPLKQELKLKLKDMLEEEVKEKYYLSDEIVSKFKLNKNITNTNVIGNLEMDKWQENMKRIYDTNKYAPTINTFQGGYLEPKIAMIEIPQLIKVRKYDVDIEKLKGLLKEHKNYTNKEIALILNIPFTTVEHWFRNDNSFSIPDQNIWFRLKTLLKIKTNEFDKSITEFEEREGVYEKANRYYLDVGIAPTLTNASANEKIIVGAAQRGRENGQQLEISNREYSNALTTVQKDSLVCETTNNLRIRKLTPKECWRLMGFDDEDFEKAAKVNSNSQLYKQAGNSIVVNVLEAILTNLLLNNEQVKGEEKQITIYDYIAS